MDSKAAEKLEESRKDWLDEMPWVRQRFHESGGTCASDCALELDKFFVLTTRTSKPLAAISPNIDRLWHRLIEFTEHYQTFCIRRYGHIVHHRSRTATSPVPDEAVRNFYDLYEAEFGSIPEIWERDAPPELIAYGRHRVSCIPTSLAWSGWPGDGQVGRLCRPTEEEEALMESPWYHGHRQASK